MNIFQWLIDESQRQPHWWGRQCAKVMLVCALASIFFNISDNMVWWKQTVVALYYIIVTTVNWYFTSNAERFLHLGSRREAFFSWTIAGIVILLGSNDPSSAAWSGYLVFHAVLDSFAICRPPKPPKRKMQLSPST